MLVMKVVMSNAMEMMKMTGVLYFIYEFVKNGIDFNVFRSILE